jgi:hypothetical protein
MLRRSKILRVIHNNKNAYDRHLSSLPGPIFLVAKALGHYVVNGKSSPKEDTHFPILTYDSEQENKNELRPLT